MSTNLLPRVDRGALLNRALEQPLVDSGDALRYAEFDNGSEKILLIEATGQPSRDIASKMPQINFSNDQTVTVNGPVRVLVTSTKTEPWVIVALILTTVACLIALPYLMGTLLGN